MSDRQPGHMDLIKQTNLGILYRLIDQAGPISRIDLSRLTQLAPASVTKLSREMIQARLVQETEIPGSGHRGRPATGLAVAGYHWHYLAVRIVRSHMKLAFYDMACQRKETASYPLPAQATIPLEQRILAHIRHFCQQHHHQNTRRIAAISLTLAGVVDGESGIVRRMACYPVHDMPLGALLSQHSGLPVFIQHDLNAWAVTETRFGAARGARDLVQLVVADYVGASIITEGKLLHAGSSSLPEIAHLPIRPAGAFCQCGHRGCLETLISTDSILTRLHQQLPRHNSLLHQHPASVKNICDAALQGDVLAKQLIHEIGCYAGQALAILVTLFNPQKILIGSPFNRAAPLLFPAIMHTLRQQAWPLYCQQLTVESTTFSGQDTIVSIAKIKDALYDGSLIMRLLHISRQENTASSPSASQ